MSYKHENLKYEFPFLLENQSEIIYSFDDFELNNPHLKGFIFKYSNAKEMIVEENETREKPRR